MNRILKYIGIFLTIIAGLLILAVVVIHLIPGDKYKDLISSGVKSATGRDLEIDGDIAIKLFPSFVFKASSIKFGNADWGSKPHMVSIDAIETEVALFPLLKGILDVTLLVDAPALHLETHSSGQGNWEFIELVEATVEEVAEAAKNVEQIEGSVEEALGGGGFPLRVRIRKVAIKGAHITYIDGKSGDRNTIVNKKLIIEPVDGKLALELAAKFNDIPLALSGDFGNTELFMNNQAATVDLAGHVGDIKLAVQGTTGPITPTLDLNVNVELNTDTVAAFSLLAGQELPDIGPLVVSAKFIGGDGKYAVNDLLATLDDKIITAEAKASLADLVAMSGLKFEANVNTDQLTELALRGSLKNKANITSKDEHPGSKESKTDLSNGNFQVKVVASVADVLNFSGIDADIKLSIDSLASLNDLVQQKMPASGSVTLEGKITSKGGLKAPAQIDTVIKSDGFMANVTGSISEPLTANGIDLDLNVEAESMQQLGMLTGTKFSSLEPLQLVGKFTSDNNSYEIAGLHLQVGQVDVKGKAAFQQPAEPGERPRASAVLHFGELDLSKAQKARQDAASETEAPPENGQEEIKKKKVFPSDPLPWDSLRKVDADIEVTLETLKTLELNLKNMQATITLDNGLLTLKPLQAEVGKGFFGGTATLDTRNSPAALGAEIELSNATFRDFGGKVNFLVDIMGSGDSVAEIMAGLDGQLQLDVRDVKLKKTLMTGFGSGLLDSLNPFAKDEEDTELICAIILFDIKEGIADANKTIAAQMTDVTWFGSGEINLITEEIDFGMHSKSRKSLNVGLGGLAKLAHLGGTLAQPKVELDPKHVAVKYGKYTAAVATGGLTVLADLLYSKTKANKDVCTSILEELDKIQGAD
jgi:uncharacterized protein involved in outer membrane biogenesis